LSKRDSEFLTIVLSAILKHRKILEKGKKETLGKQTFCPK